MTKIIEKLKSLKIHEYQFEEVEEDAENTDHID